MITKASYVTRLVLLSLAFAGCMKGPGFLKQNTTPAVVMTKVVDTQESNGAVTGTLDPNSLDIQLIEASAGSEIAGASVAFPPGSIAVQTDITLGGGGALASEETLAALDLGGAGLAATAASVTVSSSVSMDTAAPFTLSLPLPASSGLLDDPLANLIVIYKVDKNAEGDAFTGIYTKDMVEISGTVVKVSTTYFGTFQAVITKVFVPAPKEKSQTAIVAEKKAKEEAKQEEQVAEGVRSIRYVRGFSTTSFEGDTPSANDGLRAMFQKMSPQTALSGTSTLATGLISKTLKKGAP